MLSSFLTFMSGLIMVRPFKIGCGIEKKGSAGNGSLARAHASSANRFKRWTASAG